MSSKSNLATKRRMTSRRPTPVPANGTVPALATDNSTTDSRLGRPSMPGVVAMVWGLGGVIAMLCLAIVRLLAISITAFGFSLTPTHWVVLLASVAFMAYAEGYRTFQITWAPRVVGRAFELRTHWTPLKLLLAPLYCMSFFDATRKRMLTAWITTICILLAIIAMNRMSQPWRGLIDAGVVVGLSWGVAAVVLQTLSHLTGASSGTSK